MNYSTNKPPNKKPLSQSDKELMQEAISMLTGYAATYAAGEKKRQLIVKLKERVNHE